MIDLEFNFSLLIQCVWLNGSYGPVQQHAKLKFFHNSDTNVFILALTQNKIH